jgi:hypothetical protein
MKKLAKITLKDTTQVRLDVVVKKTSNALINVHEVLNNNEALFLEIEHQQINTHLELSNVSPYVLLYFNDEFSFVGAAYSLNELGNSFGIITQAKKILFIKYPIEYQLNTIVNLSIL